MHIEHVIQIHRLVPGVLCAGAKLHQAKRQAKRPLKDRFPHHECLHLPYDMDEETLFGIIETTTDAFPRLTTIQE